MALSHLEAALESLEIEIASAFAAAAPSYNIDGQAVSHDQYLLNLLAAREKLKAQIAAALATDEPFEIAEELY